MSWYRLGIFSALGVVGGVAGSHATWPPLMLTFVAIGLVGFALALYELAYGNDRN